MRTGLRQKYRPIGDHTTRLGIVYNSHCQSCRGEGETLRNFFAIAQVQIEPGCGHQVNNFLGRDFCLQGKATIFRKCCGLDSARLLFLTGVLGNLWHRSFASKTLIGLLRTVIDAYLPVLHCEPCAPTVQHQTKEHVSGMIATDILANQDRCLPQHMQLASLEPIVSKYRVCETASFFLLKPNVFQNT